MTAVDTRVGTVRCSGRGEVRTAREVEVRFVDAAGRPVPSARIESAGGQGGGPVGTAGADGVFKGRVVESVLECPAAKESVAARLLVSAGAAARALWAAELRGDVLLETGHPAQAGAE